MRKYSTSRDLVNLSLHNSLSLNVFRFTSYIFKTSAIKLVLETYIAHFAIFIMLIFSYSMKKHQRFWAISILMETLGDASWHAKWNYFDTVQFKKYLVPMYSSRLKFWVSPHLVSFLAASICLCYYMICNLFIYTSFCGNGLKQICSPLKITVLINDVNRWYWWLYSTVCPRLLANYIHKPVSHCNTQFPI